MADKKNNEQSLNNPLTQKAVSYGSLVGGTALAGSALNDYIDKTQAHMKKISVRNSGVDDYAGNRFLEEKAKMLNETDPAKKMEIAKNMRRYRRAFKHDSPFLYYSSGKTFEDYMKTKEKMEKLYKQDYEDVLKEFKDAQSNKLEELEKIIKEKEAAIPKKLKGALGVVIGGQLLAAGMARLGRKDDELVKKSSFFGLFGDDPITEDEEKQIVTYTSQNRSSFLPAAALGMYVGGVAADKLGDKLLEEQKVEESKVKQHLADVQKYKEQIEDINKKISELESKYSETRDPKIKQEIDLLKAHKEGLSSKMNISAKKAASLSFGLARNPGNFFKSWAPNLKWGALPLGAISAYQLLSKKLNPDNPGLVKDPDTAQKINTMGNVAALAGLGLMAKGLYKPLIKPMIESGKAMQKAHKISPEEADKMLKEKFENDEIVKKTKEFADKAENILSKKERDALKEEVIKTKNEALKGLQNLDVDKDAKTMAAGQALLSAGLVGSYIGADSQTIADERKRYIAQKLERNPNLLEKKSFDGGLLSEVLKGLGAHVTQNTIIKSRLHSGGAQKKMLQHLMEGNQGKVNKSRFSVAGEGFYSGTVDPDAHVIRQEMRELGKKLRNKGVDFTKLSPEDRKFLEAVAEGNLAKAKTLLPYSELGQTFFVGDGKNQIATLEEFVNLASGLNKNQWNRVNKKFKETNLHEFFKLMNGGELEKYFPNRKYWAATEAMNKANQETLKNDKLKRVREFLGKDVDESLESLNKKIEKIPGVGKLASKALGKLISKQELSLKEAEAIEQAFRILGIGASGALEPALGAWNAIKPLLSKMKYSERLTQALMAKNVGVGIKKGVSGAPLNERANLKNAEGVKDYLMDAAGDYIISPSLGAVNSLSRDAGYVTGILRREKLGASKAKKHSRIADELISNPRAVANNAQIDYLTKELNLDNLDKKVRRYGEDIITNETKEKATQVLKDLTEKKVLDKDVLNNFEKEIDQAKNEAISKGTRAVATKDLEETKKINDFSNRISNYIRSWGIPGSLGLAGLFSMPAIKEDYKDYKQRRAQALGLTKQSSDDESNNTRSAVVSGLSGATIGGALGALLGTYENHNAIQQAHSILSRLELIKNTNPDEAKRILDELKKEKSWELIKDIPAVKQMEERINSYKQRADGLVSNSKEYKELKKIRDILEKAKIDPVKHKVFVPLDIAKAMAEKTIDISGDSILEKLDKGSNKSLAKRILKKMLEKKLNRTVTEEGMEKIIKDIAEGKVENPQQHLPKIKQRVKELEQSLTRQFRELGREFKRDVTQGELSELYSKAYGEASEHLKPSKTNVVGKGLIGAGLGALAGIGMDRLYDKITKIHPDKDPRAQKEYSVAPYVAGGIALGGLAGLRFAKALAKFKGEELKKIIHDPFIDPRKKDDLIATSATFLNMPHTAEGVIEQTGKVAAGNKGGWGSGKLPTLDFKELDKMVQADAGIEEGKMFSHAAKGAALGAAAGLLTGNAVNEMRKNEISRNELLKKQSFDDSSSYKTTDALLYGGTVAGMTGLGALVGKGMGDSKKLKLTPIYKDIESDVKSKFNLKTNENGKKVFDGDYRDFVKKHQTPESLNATLENLKHFNTGKKVVDSVNPIFQERNKDVSKFKELMEEYYKADQDYLFRKEQLAKKEKLLRRRVHLDPNSEEYKKLTEEIENIVSPKDPAERERIEKALSRLMEAENKLIDSDIENKFKHKDFKIYGKVYNNLDDVKKELDSIPRKYTLRGGAVGLGTGLISALLLHRDLNNPNNQ